jgi:hypothetical protein
VQAVIMRCAPGDFSTLPDHQADAMDALFGGPAVSSGTGQQVAEHFDPAWVVNRLEKAPVLTAGRPIAAHCCD